MKANTTFIKQMGQGMTEYIVIVALIAVAAIGVYKAFGGVVRGQMSVAASTLGGNQSNGARTYTNTSSTNANNEAKDKTLKDFEK